MVADAQSKYYLTTKFFNMGYAYKINDGGAVYFITCTVNKWVDIFSRRTYCNIVIDSLNFCIEMKGLIVYGYVIMSNHVHLLVQAKDEDLSDILRDFKKFTSQTIIRTIEENKQESRKSCLPVRSGGDVMVV